MAIPVDRSRLDRFSRSLSNTQDLYFRGQMALAQQARQQVEAQEAQKTVNAFAESLFQRMRTPEGEQEAPISNERFFQNYTKARTRLGMLGEAGAKASEGLDVAARNWADLRQQEMRSATDLAEAEQRATSKFPPNVTEAQLALLASQGDAAAAAALKTLQQGRIDVKATAGPRVQQFVTEEGVMAVEVDPSGNVTNVKRIGSPKPTGTGGKLNFQIPVTYQENGKLKTETVKGLNAEDAQRQVLTQKLQVERQLQALTSKSVAVPDDELRATGWTDAQLQKAGAIYDPDTDSWSMSVNLDLVAANDPLGDKLKQTVFGQMEKKAADDAEFKKQIDAAFQGVQGAENALNKWMALRSAQTQKAQPIEPASAQATPDAAAQSAPPAPTEGAPAGPTEPQYLWQIDPTQAQGALKKKIEALNDPSVPPDIKRQILDLLLKKGYLKQG